MTSYNDLEIELLRKDFDAYTVAIRFRLPADEDQAEPAPIVGTARFDLAALDEQRLDPFAQGYLLSEALFASEPLRRAFVSACEISVAAGRGLRLRIYIDRSLPELRGLYWEALNDPRAAGPAGMPLLSTGGDVVISRFVRSDDRRPLTLRTRERLEALAFVAAPGDVTQYKDASGRPLAPVDVAGELARAAEALAPVRLDQFGSDAQRRATLPALLKLLDHGYDIVYLACHGGISEGEPFLMLEGEDGKARRVLAGELIEYLRGPIERPRLVVLASCQSAGDGQPFAGATDGALVALGPRLAEDVGIAAVVAMQGNISVATMELFMPEFFARLCEHGLIDLAMSQARRLVRAAGHADWWMPVLFLRLREGRIWYRPRFAGAEPGTKADLDTWADLENAIAKGRCLPIVGSGLIDFLLGPPRELALRWAVDRGFPMADYGAAQLPQVARYLATVQSRQFPIDELLKHMRAELGRRYKDQLAALPAGAELFEMAKLISQQRRDADEAEPFRVLAALPLPVYVTTTPDHLLQWALEAAGRPPRVAICPWNADPGTTDPFYYLEPGFAPSVQTPLIYHIFGSFEREESLVISEDDYFHFLMWASRSQAQGQQTSFPLAVSSALSRSALLFLGFQLDEWDFRVLLHSLSNRDGGSKRTYRSVAMQVSPGDDLFLRPDRARAYLERYFNDFPDMRTSIYWGSAQDFLRALWQRRKESALQRGANGR